MIAAMRAILLDLSGDTRALAVLLRDPAVTLGMAERIYLADVHEGRIKRPRNRPPRAAPLVRGENFKLACAVLLLSEGKGRQLSAAVGDVAAAEACGVSKVWTALKFTKKAMGDRNWNRACKVARKGKTPVLLPGADDDLPPEHIRARAGAGRGTSDDAHDLPDPATLREV